MQGLSIQPSVQKKRNSNEQAMKLTKVNFKGMLGNNNEQLVSYVRTPECQIEGPSPLFIFHFFVARA